MEKRQYRPKPRDEIARNMSAIRATGNRAEVALRKYLHREGLRYRLQAKHLYGRPDFVFPSRKVAVFVDGDFWHARRLREEGTSALRGTLKTSNADYWIAKFEKRVVRDDAVTAELQRTGWVVYRCWESDVLADLPSVASEIVALLERRVQ